MCINDVKKIIVEILDKKQGITLLELYDIFVRDYNGTLKVNDKKFEDILEDLLREGKIQKKQDLDDNTIYYNVYSFNVNISFTGKVKDCYECRFGMTNSDIEKIFGGTFKPNEYQRISERERVCLLNPDTNITSNEFGRYWNQKPKKCPFNKKEE